MAYAGKDLVAEYAELSAHAMLCAALLAMGRVLDNAQPASETADELIDHLWRWPTITYREFAEWYAFENSFLDYALGEEPMDPVATVIAEAGVDPEVHRQLWENLVEIVYGNLFGAVEQDWTLRNLALFADAALRIGSVGLPPARLLATGPLADRHAGVDGWGARVTDDEIARVRALAW